MSTEQQILDDIRMSARRLVAGLEVAAVERKKITQQVKALAKYGSYGVMTRLADSAGISKNMLSEVLHGRKTVGPVVARRIAGLK